MSGCADPWLELDHLLQVPAPREAFADWVGKLREARRLRNDDVTLLVIRDDRS